MKGEKMSIEELDKNYSDIFKEREKMRNILREKE